MEFQVEPNESTIVHVSLGISYTGLFPQSELYDIDDLTTPTETLDLVEQGDGIYYYKWTAGSSRTKYLGITKVYSGSYGGTPSPIDVPVPFTINVGRYSTGGVFGGSSSRKVLRTRLTKEEIKRIVKALKKEIMPEIKALDKEVIPDPRIEQLIELVLRIDLMSVNSNIDKVASAMLSLNEELKKDITSKDEDTKKLITRIDNDLTQYQDKDSVDKGSLLRTIVSEIQKDKLTMESLIPHIDGLKNNIKKDLSPLDKIIKKSKTIMGKNSKISYIFDLISGYEYVSAYKAIMRLDEKDKKKVINSLSSEDAKALNEISKINNMLRNRKGKSLTDIVKGLSPRMKKIIISLNA